MRRAIAVLAALAVALPLALLAAGQLGALRGTPPTDLGVRDGRLKPPSATPNSVSSQAALHPDHPRREQAHIDPLPAIDGDARATIAWLATHLETRPDARIVERRGDYLRVEFTTRWLRFVDDAEFWADGAAGVVQVRSASRLGHSDLGVNRQRIEALRAQLAQAAAGRTAADEAGPPGTGR
ncbi:DUF1499 domain-containing protein [Calidifontimicrobium sp. SYSU G02091]|uniref:DUF1499 domain-containing protein n=1 Tax=Calidifontimicrobium sp. SYSU G02091 TaxID=2926421 RepID=UPI001F534C80|nr:DUF1499 domain-containing protein [Calidifontimicrobium sp. SYSU G02091]MCI1191575.1 DUF1499 domain-containing protein [Calidifontimicrobium sp. SYSU G02091]